MGTVLIWKRPVYVKRERDIYNGRIWFDIVIGFESRSWHETSLKIKATLVENSAEKELRKPSGSVLPSWCMRTFITKNHFWYIIIKK